MNLIWACLLIIKNILSKYIRQYIFLFIYKFSLGYHYKFILFIISNSLLTINILSCSYLNVHYHRNVLENRTIKWAHGKEVLKWWFSYLRALLPGQ